MKKILLVAITIVLTINCLQAQDDRPVRLAFAIQPAISWIAPKGDILTNEGNRFGFSYGILTDFRIAGNPNYAFSTGIFINSQGGTLTNNQFHDGKTLSPDLSDAPDALIDAFAETAEEKYKIQYLDIPLTLKLKTNEIGYLTYYGQFGLDLSFNLKATKDVDYKFDGISAPLTIEDQDVNKDINAIRTALQVGGGVEYNISGETYILAGIVWNNGLTNIFNHEEVKADDDGTPRLISDGTALSFGEKFEAVNNYIGLTLAVIF